MPPAVAAAGIAAAGTIGTTVLNNRAGNRAADREEAARREALAYERQREQRNYQQEVNNYNAYRDWYGRRYGVELPPAQGGAGATPIAQGAALGALQQRYGAMQPGGMTLGSFAQPAQGAEGPALTEAEEPMNDGGNWNQW
jgi:hypothetical protein